MLRNEKLNIRKRISYDVRLGLRSFVKYVVKEE